MLLSTLLFAPIACGGAGAPEAQQASQDPLAAELERLKTVLQGHPGQLQTANQPVLARVEEDLRAGRRQLALQRLATVRGNIAAAEYRGGITADKKDMSKLDAEWERMGGVLRDDLAAASPEAFQGAPAAARALGEAAQAQVRGYYRASLDYAHNTMPDQGYYYLGSAIGQRELAAFSRTLTASSSSQAPPLRSIRPELEALEADMLSVYRPPLSVERHGEFIVSSSTLKEARELDAAGLRHGALLRYLQAAQIFAPLRQPAPPALAGEELEKRLQEHAARLAAGGVDHGIGQLFLETAQADPAAAPIIAGDILPRYFAALEPARPAAPKPEPLATVTLVRWPYT